MAKTDDHPAEPGRRRPGRAKVRQELAEDSVDHAAYCKMADALAQVQPDRRSAVVLRLVELMSIPMRVDTL